MSEYARWQTEREKLRAQIISLTIKLDERDLAARRLIIERDWNADIAEAALARAAELERQLSEARAIR